MPEKHKELGTEGNDIQMPGLNLDTIRQYVNDIELRSNQQASRRKIDNKDLLEFFIKYVSMNDNMNFKELIEEIERAILIKTLAKFNGNQRETAKFLGIKYTTLHEKVKRYNIYFRKEPVINLYRANMPGS